MVRRKLLVVVLVFFVITLNLVSIANAQQRIITVPNANILRKGEIYPRITCRFNPFEGDESVVLTPEIIYGIGSGIELYTGIVGVDTVTNPDPRLDLAVKKVFMLTSTTSFTTVIRVQPDLNESITPFNINYAHISHQIPATKSRFTAGMYIANEDDFLPDKPGVILGYEQTFIPDKFILAVDWVSRNETYGLLGAGIKYFPKPSWIFAGGVVIPNSNKGNFGFFVQAGKFFY